LQVLLFCFKIGFLIRSFYPTGFLGLLIVLFPLTSESIEFYPIKVLTSVFIRVLRDVKNLF